MEYSHLGYRIVQISRNNVCQYTMQNDGVYMSDFANDMSAITDLAPLTKDFREMHTHDFYNVTWVEHGGFDYIVDTVTYHVEDKSILMFLPGRIHSVQNANIFSGTSIDFTEDFFHCIDASWARAIKYDIMDGIHSLPIRNPGTEKRIKELIAQLHCYTEERKNSPQSVAKIYSSLTLLLCAIGDSTEHLSLKAGAANVSNPYHDIYLSFIDRVEKEFLLHHAVQFYAEDLRVSLSTLNTCCKANVGKTPLTIITDRIMLEAKRMLLYTEMRSKEISGALGFVEPAHFTNFFKKNAKMTPLKFREINGR